MNGPQGQDTHAWTEGQLADLILARLLTAFAGRKLNRKSLTCFGRTKPRGSVVITKALASRMSPRAHKAKTNINCIPL